MSPRRRYAAVPVLAALLLAGCSGTSGTSGSKPAASGNSETTSSKSDPRYERGRIDVGLEVEVNMVLVRLRVWGLITDAELVSARAYAWTADKLSGLYGWTADTIRWAFGGKDLPALSDDQKKQLANVGEEKGGVAERLAGRYEDDFKKAREAKTDEEAKEIEKRIRERIAADVEKEMVEKRIEDQGSTQKKAQHPDRE